MHEIASTVRLQHVYVKASSNPFDDRNEVDTATTALAPSLDSKACSDEARAHTFSVRSTTSTVQYSHEPYSSFQHKAAQLSVELFPGCSTKDITIERMKGGSFNRIVGITLYKPEQELPWYDMAKLRPIMAACVRGKKAHGTTPKQYILRIPRHDVHDLHYQAVLLAYLEHKIPYATPKCLSYSSGADNALGRAYMLQKRLPGKPLSQIWAKLTPEQRQSAARCIAEAVRDLPKVKSTCAGVVSLRSTVSDMENDSVKLEPVTMPRRTASVVADDLFKTTLASPQSTRDFLLSLIARQQTSAEEAGIPAFDKIWSGLTAMINTVHSQGLLPDGDPFVLYHPDFQRQNLLFTTQNPSRVLLSGIIDWDGALFAPKFMSTRSPFFLWTDECADKEAEGDALIEPSDPELRAYKRTFEDVVGQDFCKDAYCPQYIFLRRIWRFLVNGIRNEIDLFLAEEVLDEWEEKYPTFTVEDDE